MKAGKCRGFEKIAKKLNRKVKKRVAVELIEGRESELVVLKK